MRFAETIAEECREFGIDVNAIAPGALNTRLLDEVLAAGPEKVGAGFLRARGAAEGGGRRAACARRRACGVSRLGGERRHHRQADQRASGTTGAAWPDHLDELARQRRLHAAPDHRPRPRASAGATDERPAAQGGDRRLRPDRPASARAAMPGAAARRLRRPRPRDARPRSPAPSPGCASVRRLARRCSTRSTCDIVIVATPHDALAAITAAAVERGKQCWSRSRPRASRAEIEPVRSPARERAGVRVRVGFNHRYHPALRKARELVDAGALGALMFVRGRYGHGGRLGYEREWRADPEALRRRRADRPGRAPDRPRALVPRRLRRRARASPTPTSGTCRSTTTPSCCCATADGKTAFLHASCTEWKNTVLVRDLRPRRQDRRSTASAAATASSGSPSTACCREMGPPETTIWEYPMADDSWAVEFAEFIDDIRARPHAVRRASRTPSPCFAVVEADLRGTPAMIITRSPLRITLGGGGTDLPSYYREHERLPDRRGDRQVRLRHRHPAVRRRASILKYSKLEHVETHRRGPASDHPRGAQASSISERRRSRSRRWPTFRPAPGSARRAASPRRCCARCTRIARSLIHPRELAEQACHIEIDRLGEPIGKQDQYIAAFGGLTCFTFHRRRGRGRAAGDRRRDPLRPRGQPAAVLHRLLPRGLGDPQGPGPAHQAAATRAMIDNLHYVKDLGLRSQEALESGDLDAFGRLMHEHWEHKRKRSGGMSNPQIDEWYDLAMANGAIGGKLIGAGGGGFLMFYAEDKARLRHAMREAGLDGGPLPLRLRRHQGRRAVMPRLRMPPVAILAGGLATRLGPLTETIPRRWSRSPASRSSPISSTAAARGRRAGRAVRRPSRRHDPRRRRRRRAVRPRGRPTASTATRCSAPAARSRAPCRCSARRSSCSTATAISTSPIAPIAARIPRQRRAGPDDRVPQRGPLGHQQRALRRRRVVRYDKRAPSPDMRYIDYGLGVFDRERARANGRPSMPSISPTSMQAWPRRAARRLRGDAPLLRDRHAERACRDRRLSEGAAR